MISDHQVQIQKYRVPYQQCKHHFQKLNYICLDPQCYQNSLICSVCKDELKHAKHSVRPLKFYLQQLQQKYQKSQSQSGLNSMLHDLEHNQYKFYQKLKKAVEDVAEQFRKLQEQVTNEFTQIKNQIYEEIAKRNKFNQFYDSLKKGDIDHSNFLIQNYLPQATVGKISDLENLDMLAKNVCSQIQKTKTEIISRQSIDLVKKGNQIQLEVANQFDLNTAIKRPPNIIFEGSILSQTNIYGGGKSLCLIEFPVLSISGKLSFKILQLKKVNQFIIGVMPKNVYESMNEIWTPDKLDVNSFALGNNGYSKGWQKNEITQFGQGSTLELYYKNGELKIGQKSKSCLAKIPTDIDLFVFLIINGDTQVRVTHLK